jgi:hypothetical protein
MCGQSLPEVPIEPLIVLSHAALENAYLVSHNAQVIIYGNWRFDLYFVSNHLNKQRKLRNRSEEVVMLIFAASMTTLNVVFTIEIVVNPVTDCKGL